jgi:hypothetical protein
MAVCAVCGNEYEKSFIVTLDGAGHTFDSFECAIHALALCALRLSHRRTRHRDRGQDLLLRTLHSTRCPT